ncbi:hypothetical protein U1Q18_016002 [Sarracenia purpurea var. burkii]
MPAAYKAFSLGLIMRALYAINGRFRSDFFAKKLPATSPAIQIPPAVVRHQQSRYHLTGAGSSSQRSLSNKSEIFTDGVRGFNLEHWAALTRRWRPGIFSLFPQQIHGEKR